MSEELLDVTKYFTDDEEGVWKEPQKMTIPCEWEFTIEPPEDVTGEDDDRKIMLE